MDIHIIAVAGGSCSGKTRLASLTAQALGDKICTIVRQDNYYLDYGGVQLGEPLPNFDHPNAFDWGFLRAQLVELKAGKSVDIPTYDFVTHRRNETTVLVKPTPIILVEGILVLSQERLLSVFDRSFYVQCPADIRLERRLKRDVAERGRTPQSVHDQFSRHVAPMHDKYVIPSQDNADIVVTQEQCGEDTITTSGPLITYCRDLLS